MTTFILKIIASICMLVDHIGAVFPSPATPEVFRLIGRIAFPVYAYMIAQGCKYTKNMNKYLLRLGIFALISEIPFDLAFYRYLGNPFGVNYFRDTNVFFTLFLGAACVAVYEGSKAKRRIWPALLPLLLVPFSVLASSVLPDISWRIPVMICFGLYMAVEIWLSRALPEREAGEEAPLPRKIVALIITIPIFMLGSILQTDYGMYGVIYILFFYLTKPENRITRTIAMAWVVFLEYGYPYVYSLWFERGIDLFLLPGRPMFFTQSIDSFWFALAAPPLVFLYNGKQGPRVKWAFYVFYPAHIAVLAVIWFVFA